MLKKLKLYKVYRPFYAAKGLAVVPKDFIRCTEIEAMCINTIQPMTLRETDDNRQGRASHHNEDI